MKKYFEILKNTPLFDGIAGEDFEKLLNCLSARAKHYEKGEIIMLEGDEVAFVGLIISGSVKIIKEDERGNVSMLTELSGREMFGDILVCAGITHSPVTVTAAKDTELLLIDGKKIAE
ncbi:MAG: cyclic nucleotide-binding domain-containing protein, partial [Oscillospiraceae bacterium]|nr:cyclic nucleotide-binding domain-containing protein [Oscillospiraceae bacterium]